MTQMTKTQKSQKTLHRLDFFWQNHKKNENGNIYFLCNNFLAN